MSDHAPLPVHGYTSQPQSNVDLSNEGKILEERVLRYLLKVQAHAVSNPVAPDQTDERIRYTAIARTEIQTGFMWAIRGIFNPQRAVLPEDTPTRQSSGE